MTILITLAILATAFIVIFINYYRAPKEIKPPPTVQKEKPFAIKITMGDLEEDLRSNSTHLSTRARKEFLSAITDASTTYNISPLILYSIAFVESSFRAQIRHKQITVNKRKTNAIGLTGIVYEIWKDPLKKNKILETKSDLFNPRININACAYIFNTNRKMKLLKGTTTKAESAMRRYFGGNFKSYSDKINKKIGSIIAKKIYN